MRKENPKIENKGWKEKREIGKKGMEGKEWIKKMCFGGCCAENDMWALFELGIDVCTLHLSLLRKDMSW